MDFFLESLLPRLEKNHWIPLIIDKADHSDRDKRMRIMESVKGPAFEILQAVHFNNPNATPIEYIGILGNPFGTLETGEKLFSALRLLFQHPAEKLSKFLRRMMRVLN